MSVAYEGVCAGKRFVVTEGEVWRDNQSVGRSGHMGHALVDCGDGRILDFTSNCAGRERVSGHSGYGWMEYRISDDYGKTFGPVRVLPCSRKMYEEGRHTALCEKAVRAPDGRIVLFFQITDTSQPISCEPWSPPLMAVSSDRGETFSDFMPTGADAGRIYDAVCDDRYIYFIMQSNPHFLGTRPEHVYKVYRAGRDLKFSASVLPIDAMGRGYGALEFSADGKLHAYAYNSKCETEMDYTVSCDRGETWSAPGKSHVALKIRNPQIRRLDDIWFLIGRNGGSPADALVFYASPDGVNWDGGVRLDVRPAGTGTGYYGCMLPIREPGQPPRMLMQYSRPYLGSCVNVMHRTIVLPDEADPASFVDTRIGGSYRGHTFPGATCPFSLVQASPDTGLCDWDHCSGYVWEDPFIYGFSQTHLSGTGCPDLADVRILPFSADFAEKDPVKWRQAKDFRSERGTPGFYTVALTNDGIVAEVTATPRVGVYRFTYSAGRPVRLLVDMQWVNAHNIRGAVAEFASVLGDDRRSIGGIRRTYGWLRRNTSWHVVFDRPWTKATKLPPADPKERGERYVLEFAAGAPLVVKAAISTVNVAGARKNFAAEAEGRGFDDLRAAARGRWNALLSRMRTPGASAAQKTAFYTALYHLFIQPNDIADVDGLYRGADRQVVQAKGGAYYTGLSLWDTFRAAHPFYTLAIPERVDGFVVSMLAHYKALGFLPVIPYFGWESYCMIGNHSVPVIVDAYKKGFRGFDVDLAFEAVTNSLTVTHRNLDGGAKIKENWDLYDRYGYYPYDKIRAESVSRTLECGYDDWCAAELCKALGRGDEAFFRKRAAYWKNVFDASTGFMRGKDTQGKWRDPFDPFQLGHDHLLPNDYTEGNAFQYTWHVLQDPQGLIAAMGGREMFVKRLDALFVQPEKTEGMGFLGDVTGLIGQYAHGNEPSHHVAYFYPFAGRPDRTAEVVREVCDRFYGIGPGDLCGNDDCGQMSAWYVFAAMGFYPFNPCGGEYVLGAPQFPQVSLALRGGKTFTVRAKNLSRENKYVRSVALNGRPLDGFILRHADIMSGGELVFEMGPSPR